MPRKKAKFLLQFAQKLGWLRMEYKRARSLDKGSFGNILGILFQFIDIEFLEFQKKSEIHQRIEEVIQNLQPDGIYFKKGVVWLEVKTGGMNTQLYRVENYRLQKRFLDISKSPVERVFSYESPTGKRFLHWDDINSFMRGYMALPIDIIDLYTYKQTLKKFEDTKSKLLSGKSRVSRDSSVQTLIDLASGMLWESKSVSYPPISSQALEEIYQNFFQKHRVEKNKRNLSIEETYFLDFIQFLHKNNYVS